MGWDGVGRMDGCMPGALLSFRSFFLVSFWFLFTSLFVAACPRARSAPFVPINPLSNPSPPLPLPSTPASHNLTSPSHIPTPTPIPIPIPPTSLPASPPTPQTGGTRIQTPSRLWHKEKEKKEWRWWSMLRCLGRAHGG